MTIQKVEIIKNTACHRIKLLTSTKNILIFSMNHNILAGLKRTVKTMYLFLIGIQ